MAPAQTRFAQDVTSYRKKLDIRECILLAQKAAGKNFAAQVGDIFRLTRSDGKLQAQDYYTYGLYDDRAHSFADKRRFLSDRIHYKIIQRCCDPHWWAAADDKFLAYTLLEGCGAPTPDTRAIYCNSPRNFGLVPTLATEAALTDFLKSNGNEPLFAKPLAGVGSFGAYLIEGCSDGEITLFGGETMAPDAFARMLDAEQGYLFQSVLRPHPELVKFGEVASTVRVILIMENGRPEILHTVWKIPAEGNFADNFWREGNLLGAVNIDTGAVERVVRGVGPWQEEIVDHPDTHARILGATLPDWRKLIDLCLDSAAIFGPIRYQSWDIALCPEGPVIVEVNTGSSFSLSQVARGEGFLTERFGAFLTGCGYKLKNPPRAA